MRLLVLFVPLVILFAGCNSILQNGGGVGSAARDLVDAQRYPKMIVEIDYAPGAAPNAEAEATLKRTLVEVTGRSESNVNIIKESEVPADREKKYSVNDLVALEAEHRDHRTGGDTVALYVLYVAGGYVNDDGNARTLGVAYRGTSVAIMKGNIQDGTRSGLVGTKPEERFVERAVLVHEFGHAAGLVNLGAPMVRDHEDPDHRGHSSNQNSVMFWQVETSDILLNVLNGGANIPYQFDADDKADLKALLR